MDVLVDSHALAIAPDRSQLSGGELFSGKNLANPTSVILASIQMLEHLGMGDTAERIRSAVADVIKSGDRTTRDLGGSHGTTDFTQAVIERL